MGFGLAAIAGGLTGLIGGERQNRANSKQADRTRKWQEYMSNSAHQREVKDLRAAGLNPILSANGNGAPVPAGNTPRMENTLSAAASSAMGYSQLKAQKELADKTNALKNKELDVQNRKLDLEETRISGELGDKTRNTDHKIDIDNKNYNLNKDDITRKHKTLDVTDNKVKADIKKVLADIDNTKASTVLTNIKSENEAIGAIKLWAEIAGLSIDRKNKLLQNDRLKQELIKNNSINEHVIMQMAEETDNLGAFRRSLDKWGKALNPFNSIPGLFK